MARPQKCRFIEKHPEVTFFKPQGIPLRELQEERLTIEGYEALRLVDLLGQSIEEASVVMGVSRHIVSRVLAEGRRVVASAIVRGMALRIEGGNYRVKEEQTPSQQIITKENNMTMIAITSEGPGLESRVDPRFGRAAGFVIVNTETMETEYL
ncbi:MAG: DUF134 domain-containing protein, partial [Proteobacteria bacterium]|nr:DUF134 domain-containing protein [Pseudomonadota bacterium]